MYRAVNKDFFKHWSRDMAYVLGFFSADGYMWKSGRGAYFFGFQINDKGLLEDIKRVLCSTHKIAKRKRKDKNPQWNDSYRLQIGSKEMFEDLLHLGMTPVKSNTLTFPQVPDTYFGDFVRGYFDGDGCVHFKKYFSKSKNKKIWVFSSRFTSGCKSFLEILHKKLKDQKVNKGFIVAKCDDKGYELVFSRRDSIALFNLMYHNTDTELYLPRKKKIFDKAIRTLYMRE